MSNVFEEKNISKAVLSLSIPSMLGQLTTLVYNLADTYFVSLTRDAAQIAAVTLCTPILLMIMSIACIFGMGGSSVMQELKLIAKTIDCPRPIFSVQGEWG